MTNTQIEIQVEDCASWKIKIFKVVFYMLNAINIGGNKRNVSIKINFVIE